MSLIVFGRLGYHPGTVLLAQIPPVACNGAVVATESKHTYLYAHIIYIYIYIYTNCIYSTKC